MKVTVLNGDIERAIKNLKKLVAADGILFRIRQRLEAGGKKSIFRKNKAKTAERRKKKKEARNLKRQQGRINGRGQYTSTRFLG